MNLWNTYVQVVHVCQTYQDGSEEQREELTKDMLELPDKECTSEVIVDSVPPESDVYCQFDI